MQAWVLTVVLDTPFTKLAKHPKAPDLKVVEASAADDQQDFDWTGKYAASTPQTPTSEETDWVCR